MSKLASVDAAPPKKMKKEKSSKKRKSEAITTEEQTPSAAVPKEEDVSMLDAPSKSEDATDKEDASNDDDTEAPASKKRKTDVEEIEVDISLPEPPSKKALRRLKKGKPIPPPKSGAETTPEPEAKKPKKEVEKRSEHGVWIGNMPFHVSKEALCEFLVENSDITKEMITRVNMPGPNDHKSANKVEEKKKFVKVVNNKGFAYVDFVSAEAVKMAVELSEQLLSGRRLLIKDNKSFEGRPEKTKEEIRNEGKPPSKKVFIGNLSFDTTEDSLKEHFLKCGPISSVKVASFEDSGKCKGYGWVVFEELEGAENAVKGFVRIEEEILDTSESEDESDEEEGSNEEVKPKVKKTKLRKWWVNKIKGRPLRAEFAEDAQVRYKKRYGKDGSKNTAPDASNGEVKSEEHGAMRPAKVVEYRQPYAARLTGGIVESKGSKTTF